MHLTACGARLRHTGLFLGRRFFPPKQEVFNSGGAGYLLDKAALRVLMANIDTPKCWPHQRVRRLNPCISLFYYLTHCIFFESGVLGRRQYR